MATHDMNTGSSYVKVRCITWVTPIGDYPDTKFRVNYQWFLVNKQNHWVAVDGNITFTFNGSSRTIATGYLRLEANQQSRVLHSGTYDYNWGTNPDTNAAPNIGFSSGINAGGLIGSGSAKPTVYGSIPRPINIPTPTGFERSSGRFNSSGNVTLTATTDPIDNPYGYWDTRLVLRSSTSPDMSANVVTETYNTRATVDAWSQNIVINMSTFGHSRYFCAAAATYERGTDNWVYTSENTSTLWVGEPYAWADNVSSRFYLDGSIVKGDIGYNIAHNTQKEFYGSIVITSTNPDGSDRHDYEIDNANVSGYVNLKGYDVGRLFNAHLSHPFDRRYKCWIRIKYKGDNKIIQETGWSPNSTGTLVGPPSVPKPTVSSYSLSMDENGIVHARATYSISNTYNYYKTRIELGWSKAQDNTYEYRKESTYKTTDGTHTINMDTSGSGVHSDGEFWALYVGVYNPSNEYKGSSGDWLPTPGKELSRPVTQAIAFAYDPDTGTFREAYVYAEKDGVFKEVAEVWAEHNGVFKQTG